MKLVTELEGIWWCDGVEARKWRNCAKRIMETVGGGRLVVASGRPLIKKKKNTYMLFYRQNKTPSHMLCASFPFMHTWLDSWLLTSGFQHTTTTLWLSSSLALNPSPHLLSWREMKPENWVYYSSTLEFITAWTTICCVHAERGDVFNCRLVFHDDFKQRFPRRQLIAVDWRPQPSEDPVNLLPANLSTNTDR